jgi:hypothetical protein
LKAVDTHRQLRFSRTLPTSSWSSDPTFIPKITIDARREAKLTSKDITGDEVEDGGPSSLAEDTASVGELDLTLGQSHKVVGRVVRVLRRRLVLLVLFCRLGGRAEVLAEDLGESCRRDISAIGCRQFLLSPASSVEAYGTHPVSSASLARFFSAQKTYSCSEGFSRIPPTTGSRERQVLCCARREAGETYP